MHLIRWRECARQHAMPGALSLALA